MRLRTWHQALSACEQQGCGYVIITLIASAGSVPRDAGTKMLVTGDAQYDTIGGGHLEFQAINTARELLAKGLPCQQVVSMPLASKLGQCCGGAVKVLFEVMVCHQQHIAIFGAGHVASALLPILAQLPLQIRWIDNRADLFNEHKTAQHINTSQMQIALQYDNVKAIINDDPCEEMARLPNGAWAVILTHNHQLDYRLIEASLAHEHLPFIGMIGSKNKAKRFFTRLEHRGYSPASISKITSPIGDLRIPGKRPIEVAVSISAQLIRLLNETTPQPYTNDDANETFARHNAHVALSDKGEPI